MRYRFQWILLIASAVIVSVAALAGCASPSENDDSSTPVDDAGTEDVSEVNADADAGPSCEISYELPDGISFTLDAHTINEPERVVQLAGSYIDDIPPVLLFADGLTDGADDTLELVGGAGERTGYGYDETPGTEEDVYAMYYASINADTCDFGARLDGKITDLELVAHADTMDLDLTGLASFTEGVSLRVADVEVQGTFDEDLQRIDDVVMTGYVADDGLDELIEAVQDRISVSREQAMDLLGPDEDGRVPVEVVMDGRRVVVDGFTEPGTEQRVDGRDDVGACCPEGLEVGDAVQSHLRWDQQGIDERQAELFDEALPYFRDDDHVAMVVTARRTDDGDVHYEVYSGGALDEGRVIFERSAGDKDAPTFDVVSQLGANPLSNTDVRALSSLEAFLTAGENPEGTEYPGRDYDAGDPRLGFIPPEAMHYPFAMERIAQNFDDPRVGDFMVVPASWSTGGFSTHGNLNALQSRIPLVMAGPGIRSADTPGEEAGDVEEMGGGGETLVIDDGVRQVDIAPTVAATLGVEPTTGVGPDMRLRDDVYLKWQDGRVLKEVFTDEALAAIADGEAVADRAVVIVNDGLSHLELFHQVFSDESAFDVDTYRRIFGDGLAFGHGAVATFPSNSYSSHNSVGAGTWSGHHGIVDNTFWSRADAAEVALRGSVFETEYLFGSAHDNLPVETLFEAVLRTFGDLGDGILAASINTPSTRGAQLATFEHRRPDDDFELPEAADTVDVGGQTYALPSVSVEDHTEVMDNSTTQTFAALYQDHLVRGDDGLPVPKVSILNFGVTDTAGHRHGPHGDGMRFDVMSRTDQRLEVVVEVLESLEIDDSTLVVLTADHGMELQDQSRSSSRGRALAEAGVEVRNSGWFYYFKELSLDVESVDGEGDEVSLSLRVVDRATKPADAPLGVESVTVEVVDGGEASVVETDEEGYVELAVTVEGGTDRVLLELDHPEWNGHSEWVEL